MKSPRTLLIVIAVACFATALPMVAATYLVPSDSELVASADAIVIGTANGSRYIETDSGFATVYDIAVETVLKGNPALESQIRLVEPGGVVGNRFHIVPGAPQFRSGERSLLFLTQSGQEWTTWGLGLGKFSMLNDRDGRPVLTRGVDGEPIFGWDRNGDFHTEPVRDAEEFIRFIRATADGEGAPAAYILIDSVVRATSEDSVAPDAAPGPGAYMQTLYDSGGNPVGKGRWPTPSVRMFINANGEASAGSIVDGARSVWNGKGGSNVNITVAGSTEDGIVFDLTSVILFRGSPPPGTIAYTSLAGDGSSHTFKGDSFKNLAAADIEISSSVTGSTALQALLAHEMGHAIGFRHSDNNEGQPSANDALMKINASGRASSVRDWDILALSTVYTSGAAICPTSFITSQPTSKSITSGSSTVLSVGTTSQMIFPAAYQWYRGASGDTSSPIAGATNASVSVSPTSTTSYWVAVRNGCDNTQNSAAATVTVSACSAPSITSQPGDQTISSGQTATMSVSASGSGLSYQWYEYTTPSTFAPAPGFNTGSSYTTPALSATTSFFVRVSSSCGASVDSRRVTITVSGGPGCDAPTILQQPSGGTIPFNTTATLSVGAGGTTPLNYQWYQGTAPNVSIPVGVNSPTFTTPPLTVATSYWVRVTNSCGSADSLTATLNIGCASPPAPQPAAIAVVNSGTSYTVSWPAVAGVSQYRIDESTTPDFASVVSSTLATTSAQFLHTAAPPSPLAYYYRVTAFAACNPALSATSGALRVLVLPPTPPVPPPTEGLNVTVPFDTTAPVLFSFLLLPPAGAPSATFSITIDEPWISVSPSSGTVTPAGLVITVTADPTDVQLGANQATITVNFVTPSGGAGAIVAQGNPPPTTVPINVSLVTPVAPVPKNPFPPDNTLIIPAVAHVDGIGAQFVSDVRVGNTSGQIVNYDLTFTPSKVDGTVAGNKTRISIKPGQTIALDDIVKQWFGFGSVNDGRTGVLEIRPVDFSGKTGADLVTPYATVGSSRTYAKTPTGTFGQFIPAMAFKGFIGKSTSAKPSVLSFQQVAQSSAFRTNLGLVEGSGQAATVEISVYNSAGTRLGVFTEALGPGEHRQLDQYLQTKGITLEDGRIELRVTSDTGRVTGYASVIDNATVDPLLVAPANLAELGARKYVIAGVADIKTGFASWRSDMRVFNASNSSVVANVTFYPQATPTAAITRSITIAPGETRVMNNLLESFFGVTAQTGAVHVDTANESSLVVTARTYDQRAVGTYGQFIPAVTPAETVGLGDRALQVLQIEQSDRFRTNFGLTEVTGQPVTVQLTGIVPNSTIAPVLTRTLAGFEFIQLNSVLNMMNIPSAYNVRIAVRVIGGSGRITAYASVVDNLTQDPTYIPGQ